MENYITVGTVITTQGNVTDIKTNVLPMVVAAISFSKVLNQNNTKPTAANAYESSESQAVVFSEIKKYLDHKLGNSNYQIQNNQFLW